MNYYPNLSVEFLLNNTDAAFVFLTYSLQYSKLMRFLKRHKLANQMENHIKQFIEQIEIKSHL